jgi:hypothetical protein
MLYVLTLLIGDAAATSRVDSTSLRPSPSLAAANAMVPRIGRSLAVACCLLPPQSFMAFYGVHKEIWLFQAFYGFLWLFMAFTQKSGFLWNSHQTDDFGFPGISKKLSSRKKILFVAGN